MLCVSPLVSTMKLDPSNTPSRALWWRNALSAFNSLMLAELQLRLWVPGVGTSRPYSEPEGTRRVGVCHPGLCKEVKSPLDWHLSLLLTSSPLCEGNFHTTCFPWMVPGCKLLLLSNFSGSCTEKQTFSPLFLPQLLISSMSNILFNQNISDLFKWQILKG